MQRASLRVEISGGIAAGKTTLANLLRVGGLVPVFERFRDNPFYAAFYRDPIGTAFETEITFLLQHYHQQKIAALTGRDFCSDFSLVLDHAYACVTLPKRELTLFRSVLRNVSRKLPPRALLVHLQCSPRAELKRIARRHRSVERRISVEYLSRLDDALQARVRAIGKREKVLVIDSGRIDFAHDQVAKRNVVSQVREALRRT